MQGNGCESAVEVSEAASAAATKTESKPGRVDPTAADSQSLSCDSAEWKTSSGTLKCGTFGGKPNAIELADGAAWMHAYQELAVVPSATYRVSGEFYTLAGGECDGAAQVRWCSPSVAVCPGHYTGVSCGSTPAGFQRCVAC